MKILVLSDSHGQSKKINKIIQNYEFDHIIFLGDGLSDLGTLVNLPNITLVRGNCDLFSNEKIEDLLTVNNKKIFITHGHVYGVKNGFGALLNIAKEVNADFVFYGHTHLTKHETIDNIVFINPGSIYKNRDYGSTFGIFDINEQNYTFEIIEI